MKSIITLLIITFSFLFVSCSQDFFDQKSDKNLTVPASLTDFEMLLDDFSTISQNTPILGEIASDGHHMLDNIWASMPTHQTNYNQKNAYTWSNTFNYSDVIDWNDSYKKIFICNQVLVGISKLTSINDDKNKAARIKGNALFIKSKTYYELAQIYANQPTSEDSPNGLVLKEGVDVTQGAKRSTVYETYNEIINNLKEALPLLPTKPIVASRAGKQSCFGLLARTYLTMGDYSQAFKYADSALKISTALMDYNSLDPTIASLGTFNKEVIFYSRMANYTFVHRAYALIDEELYSMYEENDLRKSIFFLQRPNGFAFKGEYSDNPVKFTGIAVDEILLIRAEACARTNRLSEAMNDVNTLLEFRYKRNEDGTSTYIRQSASTETAALLIIINERKKELLYRGLRWSDMRRLNLDNRFKTDYVRIIGGTEYRLKANSFQFTFPIPIDEISISGIKQNPGWSQ